MAFYRQDDEENLNPEQTQQGGVSVSPESSAPQAGAPGSQSSNSPGSSAAPDNPGNFVGVKTYLDANKNQASRLGDQTAGVINKSAQGARDSLGQLKSTFDQAAGGPVQYDPTVNEKVLQGAEKLNDQEKQKVKGQYSAQYSGPMDLMDQSLQPQYTQAQQNLTKAKTNVESSGTEGGRKSLITQVNEKPRTAGITNFDNVLLQSGTGREKIAQASAANKDVTGDLIGSSNAEAAAKAQANKAAADKARTETQKAVGDANTQFAAQFDPNNQQSKLAQAISKALEANNSVYQDLGSDAYSLDAENLAKFGLSEGQRSFGVNPMDYFRQSDPTQINAGNVASAEDYARSQALAELMGGDSLLNPANASQAGSYEQYLGKIDKEGLNKAIGERGKNYEKSLGGKLNVTDFGAKTGVPGDNFLIPNPNWSYGQPTMVQGGLTDFVKHQASQSAPDLKLPATPIENASPKQLQEEWLPALQKYIDKAPKGALAQAFLRPMIDYIKNETEPYKVTSNNTFKKNK